MQRVGPLCVFVPDSARHHSAPPPCPTVLYGKKWKDRSVSPVWLGCGGNGGRGWLVGQIDDVLGVFGRMGKLMGNPQGDSNVLGLGGPPDKPPIAKKNQIGRRQLGMVIPTLRIASEAVETVGLIKTAASRCLLTQAHGTQERRPFFPPLCPNCAPLLPRAGPPAFPVRVLWLLCCGGMLGAAPSPAHPLRKSPNREGFPRVRGQWWGVCKDPTGESFPRSCRDSCKGGNRVRSTVRQALR